jgi:hypothetical protein
MKKVKTCELYGLDLNWAVATAEGIAVEYINDGITQCLLQTQGGRYAPSTNWAQGGPIIEREGIDTKEGNPLYFPKGNEKGDYYEPLWIAGKQHGQTLLIAAMRYYVASKLGDTVELPE